MNIKAYVSDGNIINVTEVGSYNINLNGRTMFVTLFEQ